MEAVFGKSVVVLGNEVQDVPDHHIGMYLTPLGDRKVAVGDPALGMAIYDGLPSEQKTLQIRRDTAAFRPFMNVIGVLEDRGFEVVRIPLLLTDVPRVYVTYNNAILETRDGEKRIYMPVYGISGMDRAGGQAFRDQGWKVIPVNVGDIYTHTGSLRCMVGIVRRGK